MAEVDAAPDPQIVALEAQIATLNQRETALEAQLAAAVGISEAREIVIRQQLVENAKGQNLRLQRLNEMGGKRLPNPASPRPSEFSAFFRFLSSLLPSLTLMPNHHHLDPGMSGVPSSSASCLSPSSASCVRGLGSTSSLKSPATSKTPLLHRRVTVRTGDSVND